MNKFLAMLLAGAFATTLSMNVFAADAAAAASVEAATPSVEKAAPMKHKMHKKHAKKVAAKPAETATPAAK